MPSGEDEQLRLARLVQEALLPPPATTLSGLELAAHFLPSARVGGDFLDYFPIDTHYFGFYLGDVQGKGLEAAMYALLTSGLMRGLHKSGTEPAALLGYLNRRLCYRSVPAKFCCLSYGIFDLEKRRLGYANAGLPFPLLLRRGAVRSLELTGHPVGLFNPCHYDQVELDLEPDDRLLFYTDGVTDSLRTRAPDHDGAHQLESVLGAAGTKTNRELAEALRATLEETTAGQGAQLADDATFLLAHVLPLR